MEPVTVIEGKSAIVLGQPHSGIFVPPDILADLNERGRLLADTDWHIDRLYEGLLPQATIVRANFNRYLIDANRSPDDAPLYAGQNTTALVPTTDFDGKPIWSTEPTRQEIARRLQTHHAPYHSALQAQLDRVKALHGYAILFDCHSIRSCAPFLFEGKLPDLNLGTNGGASCAPVLESELIRICELFDHYSYVVNGRFKGGWTTRHYGRPDKQLHAIQLELSQALYLEREEPPFAYDNRRAARLRETLAAMLLALDAAAPLLASQE